MLNERKTVSLYLLFCNPTPKTKTMYDRKEIVECIYDIAIAERRGILARLKIDYASPVVYVDKYWEYFRGIHAQHECLDIPRDGFVSKDATSLLTHNCARRPAWSDTIGKITLDGHRLKVNVWPLLRGCGFAFSKGLSKSRVTLIGTGMRMTMCRQTIFAESNRQHAVVFQCGTDQLSVQCDGFDMPSHCGAKWHK